MHYQVPPFEEAKLVRCTMVESTMQLSICGGGRDFWTELRIELTAQSRRMLYVPRGFAHGYQTLERDTEVFYQMSQFYSSEHSRGVRWNDPAFGIKWPPDERIINERDRKYPDFCA